MFDSKSPVVKIVGYTIIGFFLLIIIISFGMPDFMSKLGMDRSVVAKVNGKEIQAVDFLRYRDMNYGRLKDSSLDAMVLSNYISTMLIYEKAVDCGFLPTDSYILDQIVQTPAFKDPDTGKYSAELMDRVLKQNRYTFDSYYRLVQEDITKRHFMDNVALGAAVSSNEIKSEHKAVNTSIVIAYSLASVDDLKKRYAGELNISDAEIDEFMVQNKDSVKDPATDRARIKDALALQKLQGVQNRLKEELEALSLNNGSFARASAVMGGKIGSSKPFAVGERIQPLEKGAKPIAALGSSQIFTESVMSLPQGAVSRPITTTDGIYVFTVTKRTTKAESMTDKDIESLRRKLSFDNYTASIEGIRKKLHDEAKILNNLKK